jgi:catechol 2,3-dioxygenase-like lactoylglutathione lyase family enzyme
MTTNATDFHHVGLITHDMDKTIERYERLGFSFTPLSTPRIPLSPGGPPEPIGAGNRTAILETNYLEVLAHTDLGLWDSITPEQRGPYDLDVPLARYEGMHVMHFATDDIAAFRDRLLADGVTCSEVRSFEREVDTPDGQQMMHAAVFSFPPPANPEGLIQVAQHLTPELVLQPRFMKHANGARRVTESIVCASDPEEFARKYGRYAGVEHTSDAAGHFRVDFGGASRITVLSPEHVGDIVPGGVAPADPSLVGFVVRVADLDTVGRLLAANGVPYQEHQGRLVVSAEDACGSAVLFEA